MAFIHDDASYQASVLYTLLNTRIDGSSPFELTVSWTSESTDSNFQLNMLSPFPWRTQLPEDVHIIGFLFNVPAGVTIDIPTFHMGHSGNSPVFDIFTTNTTGSDQLCSVDLICELV